MYYLIIISKNWSYIKMSLEEKTHSQIGEVILKSILSLEGLRESSSILLNSLDSEVNSAKEKLDQLLEPFKQEATEIENLDDEKKTKITFKIPPSHVRQIKDAQNRLASLKRSRDILPRNFLISYVSEFDYFVGSLLKSIYKMKPQLLNSSGQQYAIKEILSFSTIDEIREEIIEKDIESILRSSHSEQFKTIANKANIKTLTDLDIWPKFIEITERRNLFVHTDGVISTQYQTVCKTVGLSIADEKIGKKLPASLKYLNETFDVMYEIIVKLGCTLWRKFFDSDKNEIGLSDMYMTHIVYELLFKEEHQLAIKIGEFIVEQKKHSNEFNKRMQAINLCLAYKYSGDMPKSVQLLEKFDWSSVQDLFQLAITCIHEDHEKSCTLITKLIPTKDISEVALHEWPLFKVLREEKVFKETYENLFKSSFNSVSIIDTPQV